MNGHSHPLSFCLTLTPCWMSGKTIGRHGTYPSMDHFVHLMIISGRVGTQDPVIHKSFVVLLWLDVQDIIRLYLYTYWVGGPQRCEIQVSEVYFHEVQMQRVILPLLMIL